MIGFFKQQFKFRPIFGKEGYANTVSAVQAVVPAPDQLTQLLCKPIQIRYVLNQKDEFISTESSDNIGFAKVVF